MSFHDDYYVTTDKIKSYKGTLNHYAFINKTVFLSRAHDYKVYLNERPEPFQIIVNFQGRFKMKEFEQYVHKNDTLELKYANSPVFFMDRDILLSIGSNNFEFLNARYSLDSLNDDSSSERYFSVGGIILCLLIKLTRKNAPNQALKLTE
jgi:hypothetical protein